MIRCLVCDAPKSILPPSSLASINGPRFRTIELPMVVNGVRFGRVMFGEIACNACQTWAARIAKVIA